MDQKKRGSFIAANRKKKNLTQEMLGEKLGVTNKTVSRWETGKYMPDLDTLPGLCNQLDITINELISGEYIVEDNYNRQADKNVFGVLASNNSIRKRKQLSDICIGSGTGVILGVLYSPDTIKKGICVAVGLSLLCIGWYFRNILDRKIFGN